MIRHALARVLHSLADRLDSEKPEPDVRHIYVYTSQWPTAPSWRPYWTLTASSQNTTSVNN